MSIIINRRDFITGLTATSIIPVLGSAATAQEVLNIGFVYLTTAGDHGWTFAHDTAVKKLRETYGDKIKVNIVEKVPEGPDAERVVRQLVEAGNKIIFTTSFGYMNPTLKVAKEFPNVKFEHATGYQRNPNMATYNIRFYEGRAVAGTIAGHMSKTGQAGYIASFPIPEVVMGINAFTTAARKVNPNFKTKVIWVSTWYDPAKEAAAANALIDQGCDIISQHTDSPAALQACEAKGKFAFGQGSDMSAFAPKAHLTAIVNNWAPYYIERIKAMQAGTWTSGDSWTGFAQGHLMMSPYNAAIPPNVRAAADDLIAKITGGVAHPFTGEIKDNKGVVQIKAGETIKDADLAGMKWYAEGVQE
jgi:basic membrane protein A and related proteins